MKRVGHLPVELIYLILLYLSSVKHLSFMTNKRMLDYSINKENIKKVKNMTLIIEDNFYLEGVLYYKSCKYVTVTMTTGKGNRFTI